MYQNSIEKENHDFINNIKDEDSFFKEGYFNKDINLYTTNEKNSPSNNTFLNKKRIKDDDNGDNKQPNKKHTKFSYDNLKHKCKHLVIENLMKFINEKIYEAFEGNIGNGLTIKKLMKMNQSQKANAGVEFNKKFITQNLKEIFSQKITKKISLHEPDHNKRLIDTLLSEKRDKFEKLFNLTFIECLEHFIENKEIDELKGLKLFSELKEEIVKKHEKDGEAYYENLKIFLKDFENKINRAKPRKKREKKDLGTIP